MLTFFERNSKKSVELIRKLKIGSGPLATHCTALARTAQWQRGGRDTGSSFTCKPFEQCPMLIYLTKLKRKWVELINKLKIDSNALHRAGLDRPVAGGGGRLKLGLVFTRGLPLTLTLTWAVWTGEPALTCLRWQRTAPRWPAPSCGRGGKGGVTI